MAVTVLALYYPERVEFRRTKRVGKEIGKTAREGDWEMDEEAVAGGIIENPYGEIPVFRFTPDSIILSDVDRAIPLQDVVNKLKTDMMISAEFSAAATRWILSNNNFPEKIPLHRLELYNSNHTIAIQSQRRSVRFRHRIYRTS